MKKSILLLAAGAMALTACTQSEVVEEGVQSNAIGFQNVVSKETRALTNTSLNTFYVSAYYTTEGKEASPTTVFTSKEVTKQTDGWKYDNTRYWVKDATYYFYAYSCDNNALSAAYGSASINISGNDAPARALRINNFVCNDSHQHDLVVAKKIGIVGQESGNTNVPLDFKHVLSKLTFEFESGFPEGYTVEVSNVQIAGIFDKGTFNYATMRWVTPLTKITAEPYISLDIPGEKIATKKQAVTSEEGYVIPYTYTSDEGETVELNFTVKVKNNNRVEFLNRNLTGTWSPRWELGKSYTYHVTVSGSETDLEPIVFETATDMNLNWSEVNTDNVNLSFSAN